MMLCFLIQEDKNEVYTSGSNDYKQMGLTSAVSDTKEWHLVEAIKQEPGRVLKMFSGTFFSGVIMQL
jgi:hypothetical protein